MSEETHPLLKQYDAELHAITLKYRKNNPEWWFYCDKVGIRPTKQAKPSRIQHKTEVIHMDTIPQD